jgi:hypothetical protein
MLKLVSPDADMAEEASAVLRKSPYRDIRDIAVDVVQSNRLRLCGVVASFYFRQLAQEMIRQLAASQGTVICNEIQVENRFGIVPCADDFCPA